jgi:putative endonuclease
MHTSAQRGRLGEQIAREFLQQRGYAFVMANYRNRGGEIDLIMRKARTVFFVEVKTRRAGNPAGLGSDMGGWKLRRMRRAISDYVAARDVEDWACLLVTVRLLPGEREARVAVLEI